MSRTFVEKHLYWISILILLLSLGLAACASEFNAKPRKAPMPASLSSPLSSYPTSVDRRIKLGGIPSKIFGVSNSARLSAVAADVKVAGTQVSGKLSITN